MASTLTELAKLEKPAPTDPNQTTTYNADLDVLDRAAGIYTGTAGETLADGDAVYQNTSDGKFYKALHSSTGKIGVATHTAAGNATIKVRIGGVHKKTGWGLSRGFVYVSDVTAGLVTNTQPSGAKPFGWALASDTVELTPWLTW